MDGRASTITPPLARGPATRPGPHLGLPTFPQARTRRVRAGTVLAFEGVPSGSVIVLLAGAVTVALTSLDGRRVVTAILGPGDVHGEESLAPADPAGGFPEVRALTTSTLLVLPGREMHEAMARDPAVSGWVANALSRKAARLQERLAHTLSASVGERTMAVLQHLAEGWGRPSLRGRVIDLPLSQELLAALVGASRESVNRSLKDLRARGAVLRSGRRYVIPLLEGRTGPPRATPEPPGLPAPA